MSGHADIPAYPGSTVKEDDIIYDKWTAKFFADLNENLTLAESVGLLSSQGSSGSFANPNKDDIITAQFYNAVESKFEGFNARYSKVNPEDLITAAIANAIQTAYSAAQFKITVCDVCNTE